MLGAPAEDVKKITKASTHMHDTMSSSWERSLLHRSELSMRLRSAVRILLANLLSCVRVQDKSVPVETIVDFVFSHSKEHEKTLEKNDAITLNEVRKAVHAAVQERRICDAKMMLTLGMKSFGDHNVSLAQMQRFFTHVQPILRGSKVVFASDPKGNNSTLARRNWSYTSKKVSRGVVVDVSPDRQTIEVECYVQVKSQHKGERSKQSRATKSRVKPEMILKKITVPMKQAHHCDDVYVNKSLLKSAQQFKEYMGVGVPPVSTPSVENAVISLAELTHFITWIFSPTMTTALKAKGHDGERGRTHQLKDFAARTWPLYRKHAIDKISERGLSYKNYCQMLKLPVFKRASPEECACAQCVTKGWEGIYKLGKKLLKELDAIKNIWITLPSSPEGADLEKRLSKCWDFLRTRLGSHMRKQSDVASHCLSWLLSSRSDSRLSTNCTHDGASTCSGDIPEYTGPYDQRCSGTKCDGKDGTVNRGRKLSASFYACRYCSTISCPDCIRTMWGQSEYVGKTERKQRMFICRSCSRRRCQKLHVMSCPECNSVQYFKMDLRRCRDVVQDSSTDAKVKKRIEIMVNRLCRNIDLYIGHVARDRCQSGFWPEKLQEWAQQGVYDEALILSDFWRIFDGTYERRVNCDTGEKQSVETHCVWSLCPPEDKLDMEDKLRLPAGVLERLRAGEKVFLVNSFHQFCDITTQSVHQAVCNFLSLLEVIKKFYKWIRKCWRQSDNCYTYESKKSCLAMTEVGKITGIHVLGTNNNEPSHGGGLADTAGAIMKNALWSWTRRFSRAIQQARYSARVLHIVCISNQPTSIHS